MSSDYQIIPFRNLKNRMVQTDDANDFKESFFKEVYDQAAALTNIIAQTNDNIGSRDDNLIHHQQTRALQNVIAFTGRRGTGKTSAMLSFAEALSKGRYAENKLGSNDDNPFSALQGKNFYALQYVDSSIVSKDEDFFEILLYRMLQYLNCYVEQCGQNVRFKSDAYLSEIREKTFTLYKHYVSIRRKDMAEAVSSYTLMEKNIEKHNVRNEIIKLVEDYIKFLTLLKISGNCDGHGKGFLLICIDDIDMANSQHLDILQCIYQYFMIPNVVVMITLNVPVINATVRKSFYSNMEIPVEGIQDQLLHISQEQTMDFLRKIIPSDMRITMPSWRKYDYRTLKTTKISFTNLKNKENEPDIFPNINGCFWYAQDHEMMTPKKLILLLLADRTGIFLDMAGVKIHFMEPDSLRNLYDLFYLLYHMKNIKETDKINPEKKEQYYQDRRYNRTILLNYLYFKMIPEFNFDHALEMEFKGFQAEPMDRRGRRIWDYYYKVFMKTENRERIKLLYGKDFFEYEQKHYNIANYCFGELFRCLYIASRLDLVNKNFVKAVLASFAFTLPQYIETEKKSFNDKLAKIENEEISDDEKKQRKGYLYRRQYSKLRDVFGYSFLGTWRKELYSELGPFAILRAIQKPIQDSRAIQKPIQDSRDSQTPIKERADNKISITIDVSLYDTIKDKKKFFIHLIYLFLLSTKSVKDNFTVTQLKCTNTSVYYIDADLDPTAFIVGTVRANRLKHLRFTYNGAKDLTLGALLKKIGIDFSQIIKIKNGETEEYKTEAIETYINNCIDDAVNSNKELIWFLLKHPDITYNVVKRTISFFLYYSDANLQVRPIEYRYPYKVFKKFYEIFVEKLAEELNAYKETQYFQKSFKECNDFLSSPKLNSKLISPIIDWFLNSSHYGFLSIHTAENDDKELFTRFGCGIDLCGLNDQISKIEIDKTKDSPTLDAVIESELDEVDKKNYHKTCESHDNDSFSEMINRKVSVLKKEYLHSILLAIYCGNKEEIKDVLINIYEQGKDTGDTPQQENMPHRKVHLNKRTCLNRKVHHNKRICPNRKIHLNRGIHHNRRS